MADRHEVHPHQVLRAVLREPFVADVLAARDVSVAEVQVTLEQRWLAAGDTIELEEIEALGVDVPTLLRALDPPYDGPADWGDLRLTPATRDVLVGALRARAGLRQSRTSVGHLLLALLASRDPIVAATFAAHGLRARDVRPLVQKWGRRAE